MNEKIQYFFIIYSSSVTKKKKKKQKNILKTLDRYNMRGSTFVYNLRSGIKLLKKKRSKLNKERKYLRSNLFIHLREIYKNFQH